jgi:hypothetical protein
MVTEKIGTFYQGTLTGAELQRAVTEAWTEIARNPDALAELGVDAETASTAAFSVDAERIGFEGILLGIVIAWAGEAAWEGTKKMSELIVTKVRDRHGVDAIGEATDSESSPSNPSS